MEYERYRKFRQETYQMLGKAKDATFELMDSVMTTRNASCLAEFSLSPLFRRKWSSTYEALQDSRPNRNKLMRIRSNCCLWLKPTSYSGKGRPKKHARKFKVNDSTTWWSANETVEVDDSKLGKLRISQWKNLHFRSSSSHDLNLIQVERIKLKKSGKKHRSLWLVWVGEQFLELKDVWTQYARRFERRKCVGFPRLFHFAVGVDHWYRFAKQRLHWTLPSFSTAKQCQRWSDLMPLMTWQLWLGKDLVKEHHLPWQSCQKNLTPGRVAQSLFSLLVEIGTPTTLSKARGK